MRHLLPDICYLQFGSDMREYLYSIRLVATVAASQKTTLTTLWHAYGQKNDFPNTDFLKRDTKMVIADLNN